MRNRRDLLKYFLMGSGCFAAKAFPVARLNTYAPLASSQLSRFPQGVASADPQEDGVMLWTRIEPELANSDNIKLVVQICEDGSFERLTLQSDVIANFSSDHCIRFFAQGLMPDHTYYYRFITEGMIASRVGRTRTAPKADADRKVNFAWACCQNYEDGFYSAWARMLEDDRHAENGDKLDFILHVGDFIYESINAGFRDERTRELYGDSSYLKNHSNRERRLPPLPSGGSKGKYGGRAAVTLEDYRHIYKEYLKDPNLQAARARWPFICIWDDHEFADNCWQSHLGDKANQKGRLAANQAWFEYMPALLGDSAPVDGVESQAQDFEPAFVENLPFGDPGQSADFQEKNNQTVINSLHIYRAIRYGRNLKLVLTDNRLYRSDHAIPEWWQKKYFSERPLLKTPELLRSLEATGSGAEDIIHNNGVSAPNPRAYDPAGTMLGERQKNWWKESIQNTDASWKVWANSVPLMSLSYEKFKDESERPVDTLHSADMWDGYPAERRELLEFLKQKKISNVVSLSGDLHAHIAGRAGDIEGEAKSSLPEFIVAGLSSVSMYRIIKLITSKNSPFFDVAIGFEERVAPLLDHSMLNSNPHIDYLATDANGYGQVQLNNEEMKVSLITMKNTLLDTGSNPGEIQKIVKFSLMNCER